MAKPAHITNATVYRSLDLKAGQAPDIDVEARTATLTFASDYPVERWDWVEVLDMSGMSTDRLGSGRAALLVEHERTDQIGVIQSIALADGVWRATVKFSRSVRGQEFFQDVIDGIRTLVSVGYSIDEVVLESDADGVRTYRVSRWTPHEISIVSIPADPTVGVGRAMPTNSADTPAPTSVEKLPVQVRSHQTNKETQMDTQDPVIAERARTNDIIALGAKHKADTMARDFIASGKSVAEFREALLDRAPKSEPVRTATIGMTNKEAARFSIMRAINAAAEGDWSKAGFEREVSAEAIRVSGRSGLGPNSFKLPADVLQRASQQNVTNLQDGGYFVKSNRPEGFIAMMQNSTVLDKVGASFMYDIEGGKIELPKETGLLGVQVVGEDVPAQFTKFQLGQVEIKPFEMVAKTSVSRRLRQQSSISVDQFLTDRFSKQFGLKIDNLAFTGSGVDPLPLGIVNAIGAGQKLVVGADIGWDEVVELETLVSSANADGGTLSYVGNSKTRGHLKTAEKSAGTAQFIWTDSAPGVGMVNGYSAYVTNHLPGALPLIYGNYASLRVVFWSGMDVVVDTVSDDSNAHIVKVFQTAGIGIDHEESFAMAVPA